MRTLRDDRGFTLVELLVVVTILGVLSAVAVLAVGGSTADSKVAACKADVATVQTAADSYAAKTGNVPASVAALTGATPPYLRSAPANISLVSGTAVASPAC